MHKLQRYNPCIMVLIIILFVILVLKSDLAIMSEYHVSTYLFDVLEGILGTYFQSA